jgi:hypothetical protein
MTLTTRSAPDAKMTIMRDVLAGLFALAVLILIAVAPSWERPYGNSATAPTPTPTPLQSATPTTTPISRAYDLSQALTTGPGFAVCGASDTWTRPTIQQQAAYVAKDPRYRDLRFDDNSPAAQQFRSAAAIYDGAGNSSRTWLVMNTGLWSDQRIGGTGCQTKEQQVWLFGLAPDRYEVFDGASAALTVHAQPGYRMVVITGEPRYSLVVFDGQRHMKLELLTMMVGANSKAASSATPVPSAFPQTARPLDLVLYPSCQITSTYRHTDELGVTWYVQCGAGKVNVSIPGEAVRQGWVFLGGDQPYGMQVFQRGKVWMQIFYRRDAPGIEDPFGILQTYRPLAPSPAPRPTP